MKRRFIKTLVYDYNYFSFILYRCCSSTAICFGTCSLCIFISKNKMLNDALMNERIARYTLNNNLHGLFNLTVVYSVFFFQVGIMTWLNHCSVFCVKSKDYYYYVIKIKLKILKKIFKANIHSSSYFNYLS